MRIAFILSFLLIGCGEDKSDSGEPVVDTGDPAPNADWDADGYEAEEYGGEDCDDTDPNVHPGAEETWYDDVDQDCDGGSDYDADGDGYDLDTYGGEDCDDEDPDIHPDAGETSWDQVDEDCDGVADEGFVGWGDLLVTEVMITPSVVSDAMGEWFEVYNDASEALELEGWQFKGSNGDSFLVEGSLQVEPGAYAVLGSSSNVSDNGGYQPDAAYAYGDFSFDESDGIYASLAGEQIWSVTWTEDGTHEAGAARQLDPLGLDEALAASADYWCSAQGSYGEGDLGSPGSENGGCSSVDHDGDGLSEDDGDCDDESADIYPGADEQWDFVDTDCDGWADRITPSEHADGELEGDASSLLGYLRAISTGDIDDDGALELLVGSTRDQSYRGKVWMVDLDDPTALSGAVDDAAFATVTGAYSVNYLATMGPRQGDVTGDGVVDVFIAGSDSYYADQGNYAGCVFTGGEGLEGDLTCDDAELLLSGSRQYMYAAASSHLDLDADGIAEVLYGDYYSYSDLYRGSLYVVDAEGLSGEIDLGSDPDVTIEGTEQRDYFGSSIGGGDVNGDGYDDVLVGAYGESSDQESGGAVYLFHGGEDLLEEGEADESCALKITGGASMGYLGMGGAGQVLDVHDDGVPDLAVSEPETGAVYLFFDGSTLTGTVSVTEADVAIEGGGPDYLGQSLATGDLDGDGLDDLVLGAPDYYHPVYASYYADDPGEVVVFTGEALAEGFTGTAEDGQVLLQGSGVYALGCDLVTRDLDADGQDDLLVGEPAWDADAGRLLVFLMP